MKPVATARTHGLASCGSCLLVSRLPEDTIDAGAACPRCGAALHSRKSQSVARTWAYVIAAYVLYIPANVLPITHTRTLLGVRDDTIMSGIVYLRDDGSWFLAAIVFIASIAIPLVKLLVLTTLLWSVHRQSSDRLIERTSLFRAVNWIGRWSMLDIYVLALLTSLVQAGAVTATIRPGPGALAFASVVVLTLLAAAAFDPRLMWDAARVPAAIRRKTFWRVSHD